MLVARLPFLRNLELPDLGINPIVQVPKLKRTALPVDELIPDLVIALQELVDLAVQFFVLLLQDRNVLHEGSDVLEHLIVVDDFPLANPLRVIVLHDQLLD